MISGCERKRSGVVKRCVGEKWGGCTHLLSAGSPFWLSDRISSIIRITVFSTGKSQIKHFKRTKGPVRDFC